MHKILFIAPEEKTAKLAEKLACSLGIGDHVKTAIAVGEDRLRLLQSCNENHVEVVISRWGYSFEQATRMTHIPLLNVEITGYDIARTLATARAMTDKVGVVHMAEVIRGISRLAPLYDMTLAETYVLRSDEQRIVHKAVEHMKNSGVQLIIGGVVCAQIAELQDMKCIRITAGEEAIEDALLEAWRLIPVKQRERERAEHIRAIMDFSYDGIIAIDKHGIIFVFNPMAERITRVKANSAIGKHIDKVVPELQASEILTGGTEPELGGLCNIGGIQVSINRIPIVIKGETVGAVVNLLDIKRIQSIEIRARKELATRGLVAKVRFDEIIGASLPMLQAIEMAKSYSQMDSPILISGETGTGKEMFAQSIHNASPRANGPFVAVNCAALPESLLESELFGYVEGAFTGARKQGKSGLFELAHRGTIFLDEIGEMPPSVGAKLLRVIQENEVIRIGDDKVIPINVRIISATNRDIRTLVKEGKFREDLFYRLNVLNLTLPPLRERGRQDILLFLDHFMKKCELRMGYPPRQLSPEELEMIIEYSWPGNVRELANFVERLAALTSFQNRNLKSSVIPTLLLGDKPSELDVYQDNHTTVHTNAPGKLRDIENDVILTTLEKYGGNRKKTAETLGISQTTLWRRLKALEKQIDSPAD